MEDASGANCYMRTRCPSWCDRILFSKSAKSLVYMNHDENNQPQVRYQLVGSNVAMGDHKPVLLWFRLLPATEVAHRHFSSASSPHLLSCDSLNLTLPRISLTVPTSPDSATFTRYIHVKYPGSPVRIFRETTV
ncbi:inositol polyphosphate-5-phosphatase A-like isoform X2 [Centruroides vittatus]|uniref:inositol polyphosphate-5-phosphatase A-like isoform X2 n=1 Tax=Centruroides vittatus TaxID=120091 RepID=UPI00350FB4AB